MDFLKDLFDFLKSQKKKWWLIPIMLALLVLGLLIIFAESTAVSTFIYPIF
jgi:hypothetical protein